MTNDEIQDIASDEAILVEYLDGELALRDRQIIEKRLAEEPELRECLERLEKSWQCLDFLERNTSDKDLVETTLETVIVSAEQSILENQRREKRHFPWKVAAISVFLVLVFWFSFHAGERMAPNDHFLVAVATPIIERLDMYQMLLESDPDLELLRLLAEKRVFLPPLPEDAPPVDPKEYRPASGIRILESFTIHPTFAEMKRRVDKIERLDGALYDRFYWNNQKFISFSWRKRWELKSLHESIEQSPRRYELYQTLQNYYTWLTSLQSYERSELRRGNRSVSERLDKIVAMKKNLENDHATVYAAPLATDILKSEGDIGVQDLAGTLSRLNPMQREQVLNAAPDQTVGMLLRLFSETPPHAVERANDVGE